MCWTGNLSDKKIAEDDISVYKILSRNIDLELVAPYQRIKYNLHKLYSVSEFGMRGVCFTHNEIEIREGFHSFNSKCKVWGASTVTAMVSAKNMDLEIRGKLSDLLFPTKCIIPIRGELSDLLFAAKCIIPKGSEYYENDFGEIVSNKIIIDCIYDIPYDVNKHFYELKGGFSLGICF